MTQILKPKQRKAISALLELPTVDQAADRAGVKRRTVYRWLDMPHFRAALAVAEGDMIDIAGRRLINMASDALDALQSVLERPSQPGATNKRLAAATILDNLMKLRELRTVESRLAALEAALHERKK
jgi:hypothetical protein